MPADPSLEQFNPWLQHFEHLRNQGLLGFADLHTHPAAHLAFGADTAGNDGMWVGTPGTTPMPGGDLSASLPQWGLDLDELMAGDDSTEKMLQGIIFGLFQGRDPVSQGSRSKIILQLVQKLGLRAYPKS